MILMEFITRKKYVFIDVIRRSTFVPIRYPRKDNILISLIFVPSGDEMFTLEPFHLLFF